MSRLALSLLATCLLGRPAFAQNSPDAPVLYSGADIVFTGRLQKVNSSSTELTASFQLAQALKGVATASKLVVVHFPLETRCHKFEEDHLYLVYAHSVGDQLWADQCDSKLESQAEADLRYIHTVNPSVHERCSPSRLQQLALRAPVIATAELVATEDSLPPKDDLDHLLLMRPWCGLVASTEDAFYKITEVLKGDIPGPRITVEHLICWDTVTVDGYYPNLSPELFKEGNNLLLFLKAGSHGEREGHVPPREFPLVFQNVDENCGAVKIDDEAALDVLQLLKSGPVSSKRSDPSPDQQ